ncbi:MAG: hypothetical protein MI742_03785 [Desulfobacterales bacterium]|nr:hypothetical protein [Desulfobacterales bacterium]
MRRITGRGAPFFLFFFSLFLATPAYATQGHGGIEGILVHQAAHVLFALAMGFLVFRINRDELPSRGWRKVRFAAILFILWNIDTIFVHFVDEQVKWVTVTRLDGGRLAIDSPIPGLPLLYYIAKLDHLLCVPAIALLWLGLKQLLFSTQSKDHGGEAS